jgi:ABC-2 type transport system ATP-binding protein
MTLDLNSVAKRYGRKRVLDGVDASFGPGLNLLIGPSGAGKTTLLRLIATAEKPNAGRIEWDGKLLPAARRELRATLGYAPQAVDLPDQLTAREFGAYMAALKGLEPVAAEKQFEAITDTLGLHPDIDRQIGAYSGGMRRRLIFAQALLGSPRLLALDEPTAELDPDSAARVNALVLERAKEAVVVMTTHLADSLAPLAASVLRVADGTVVRA